VLNPVRAGFVTHSGQWPWSSYAATAGERPVPAFLRVDWVLALGDTRERAEAEHRYRQFVAAGLAETATSLERLPADLVVGVAAVPPSARTSIRNAATLVEIPRAQRFALRLPLATLFAGVTSRKGYDACCVGAVRDHGYTMKAVAAFLGVHYVTVSRAVTRGETRTSTSGVSDCKT